MSGASVPREASRALDEYWNDKHGLNKGLFQELGVVSGLATRVRVDWPAVLHALAQTYGSAAAAVGPVNVCLAECCIALTRLLRYPDDDEQARPWNRLLRSVAVSGQLVLELRVGAGTMTLPTMHLEREGVVLSVPKSRRFHYESHLEDLFRAQALATVEVDQGLDADCDSCDGSAADPDPDPDPRARRLPLAEEVTGAPRPPFHLLIFTDASGGAVTVLGNHADSVAFVYKSLQKFVRDDCVTRAALPFIDVSPVRRALRFYDIKLRITVNENDQGVDARQSLPFLFHLAEAFLGYRRVHTSHGSWEYRTDTPYLPRA